MHMQRSDVRYFFEAACVSLTRVRTYFCVMRPVFAWRSECHDLDFASRSRSLPHFSGLVFSLRSVFHHDGVVELLCVAEKV